MSYKFYMERLVVGIYAENCYILADEETKECAVIDPGADFEKIKKKIESKELTLKYILLTHAHFDHIGAVAQLQKWGNAPVYVSYEDKALYEGSFVPDYELVGGEIFELGTLKIKTIRTPGHTQGGCCFYIPSEKVLISGDTLFYRSVGRSDLPGGNHKQLINAIIENLMTLPDDTQVFPGHGSETTIGFERAHNSFIQG